MAVALSVGCEASDGSDDDASAEGDAVDDGNDDAGNLDGDVPNSTYCSGVSAWGESEASFEMAVLDLVNLARASARSCGGQSFSATSPVGMEPRLRCAARVHSQDMAERGYFDHTNLEGESPFDRMERAGYRFRAAGENIAAGQPTPEDVVNGWLESPGHCSNIMSPDFQHLGVGYYFTQSGQFPHYWTQVFGTQL